MSNYNDYDAARLSTWHGFAQKVTLRADSPPREDGNVPSICDFLCKASVLSQKFAHIFGTIFPL